MDRTVHHDSSASPQSSRRQQLQDGRQYVLLSDKPADYLFTVFNATSHAPSIHLGGSVRAFAAL